jgi:malonyl-CoA decarboxylase
MSGWFKGWLLSGIAGKSRQLISWRRGGGKVEVHELLALCEKLLTGLGEASGVAIASEILAGWQGLGPDARGDFLLALARQFGPDRALLEQAIDAYRAKASPLAETRLMLASEPRRQELIRRLNLAPGATAVLVRMREDLFKYLDADPAYAALDADFVHLFSSWFNRGFLVLRRIDWTTPANILDKIIRYEAVHAIDDWDDLRQRLEPADRRCFAFFHPQLADEPLIFVEVALCDEIPKAIEDVLADERKPISPHDADTAVFYSISNCQTGLRGISFGNFLIKQVVDELTRELPRLSTFVTLSPAPNFASWLTRERSQPEHLDADEIAALAVLDNPDWGKDAVSQEALKRPLLKAAAAYFLKARTKDGRIVDAVARFHLGNGARLERLDFLGDPSPKGMKQSFGLMVNYLYDLADIEENHEAYAAHGQVASSPDVRKLLEAKSLWNRSPFKSP